MDGSIILEWNDLDSAASVQDPTVQRFEFRYFRACRHVTTFRRATPRIYVPGGREARSHACNTTAVSDSVKCDITVTPIGLLRATSEPEPWFASLTRLN
jgi:hypothetical protein